MIVSTLALRARQRMQPPPPPDPVTQYARDVVAGRVIAGQLVRRACERHLRDLANGHERGLRWDVVAAERAISFFPLLRRYKGEWGPHPGKPQGELVKNRRYQIEGQEVPLATTLKRPSALDSTRDVARRPSLGHKPHRHGRRRP